MTQPEMTCNDICLMENPDAVSDLFFVWLKTHSENVRDICRVPTPRSCDCSEL